MKILELEKRLFEGLSEMEIIDCHEHLPPEEDRLKKPADVFTLFSHYTHYDLLRAGMSEESYQSLFNRDIPLETRWKYFVPYWEKIRHTSYSKAVLLTAEKFYGHNDINEKTYHSVSEAVRQANKPGLYEKVLRKTCKIKTCLTQCGRTDLGTDLLTPLMPLVYDLENPDALLHPPFDKNAPVRNLDDYLDAVARYIIRVKKEGAVGLKTVSNPYGAPNRKEAAAVFEKIVSGEQIITRVEWPLYPVPTPLRSYIVDQAIKLAGAQNLVVAVHTGYWGDFRQLDPLHMIPILMRHPNVRFDIYHLGYPWLRETLMLGKGFSNVWLNFCWTSILSQRFARAGFNEALDLIPSNKILAFGGDYGLPVEKVYGHLVMARQDVANVLAKRIEEGRMDEEQALKIAYGWFRSNPEYLYNLT